MARESMSRSVASMLKRIVGLAPVQVFVCRKRKKIGVRLDRDAALAVVHEEAALRRGQAYLSKTQIYVKQGKAPPVELDQAVQAKALEGKGFRANASTIETYQATVRSLPINLRQ